MSIESDNTMSRPISIVLGATILLTGGCSVTGDASEVAVEHSAEQFMVAEAAAEKHCAKYGKSAQHVQTSPERSTVLFLRSKISTFECVAP